MNFNDDKTSYGITTGSAATAAALAALLCIKRGKKISSVEINTPFDKLKIDVHRMEKLSSNRARAFIIKKPYNDPDVTINMEIGAEVEVKKEPGIIIKGGEGVGLVTKPGLQIPVGQPAINPVPIQMLHDNLKNYLEDNEGAVVTVFVPEGKKIASRTMNPKLGIVDGISILGTTGIARSMSSASYKQALTCQIDVALGLGYEELIFVPGNIGEKLALESMDIKKDQIVQMSNCVGHMLKMAHEKKVKKIIMFGHAGKLVKIAGGIFNTQHSVADARREIVMAHAALMGAPTDIIKSLFSSKTTEDMVDILIEEKMEKKVFDSIARSIKEKCLERYPLEMEIIIVRMDGTILSKY